MMLEKDSEIKMRTATLNKQKADIKGMENLITQDLEGLTLYTDTHNDKTLTADVVDTIWHPNSSEGGQIAETLAKLRSMEELSKMFFDLYEDDRLKLSYDEMKKVVEKMAKEEFTVKHKLRNYAKSSG